MSPLLSDTVVSPIVGGASADTRLEVSKLVSEERFMFDSHIPRLAESAESGYVGQVTQLPLNPVPKLVLH